MDLTILSCVFSAAYISVLQDFSQTGRLFGLHLALQAEAFRQDTGSGRLWKLNLWLGQIIESIYENWRPVSGLKQCMLKQFL